MNEAEQADKNGQFGRAIEIFRQVAGADPAYANEITEEWYGSQFHTFREQYQYAISGAMYRLGSHYEKGQGVPKNYTEALRWFKASAALMPQAGVRVGYYYALGIGMRTDRPGARNWWVHMIDVLPLYRGWFLGPIYLLDHDALQDTLAQLDVEFDAQAAVRRMQDAYANKNYKEAAKWAIRATMLANNKQEPQRIQAQTMAGALFLDGQGIKQDYDEAFRLLKLAADKGNIDAQFNLGRMYADGLGTSADRNEAERLMQSAVNSGSAQAQTWLRAAAEARQREEAAAEVAKREREREVMIARLKQWAAYVIPFGVVILSLGVLFYSVDRARQEEAARINAETPTFPDRTRRKFGTSPWNEYQYDRGYGWRRIKNIPRHGPPRFGQTHAARVELQYRKRRERRVIIFSQIALIAIAVFVGKFIVAEVTGLAFLFVLGIAWRFVTTGWRTGLRFMGLFVSAFFFEILYLAGVQCFEGARVYDISPEDIAATRQGPFQGHRPIAPVPPRTNAPRPAPQPSFGFPSFDPQTSVKDAFQFFGLNPHNSALGDLNVACRSRVDALTFDAQMNELERAKQIQIATAAYDLVKQFKGW